MIIVGMALPVYALTDSPVWFVTITVLAGLANGFSGATPAAYVADVAPARARGTTAGIVGPILLGWLIDAAVPPGSGKKG